MYIYILYIYIYTLSHPGAYGQRKFASHRPQASIGRKIIENLKISENPPGPPKIYLDDSASHASQMQL